MSQLKFSELPLSAEMHRALEDMGFSEATPIQEQAIPFVMAGRDVIGQAQTGTGKTAAFGIPALENIDEENRNIQVLVLCPTRELANQVASEIKKMAVHKRKLNTLAIYGGESIEMQIKALKRGVQIVVGTPGRVQDHINRRTLDLSQTKMIVLDEADEMLNMGFREAIEEILLSLPEERQTVLFSATMPPAILNITKKFQNNPEHVKTVTRELTVDRIDQYYYDIKGRGKTELLTRLIDVYGLKLMLIFCNTKRMVDDLVSDLQQRGYSAEGLHGDLRQNQRTNVMGKFKSGVVGILVATDVAARGIDVDNVEAVFNYDIPLDSENYVHRIGRTGRAGKSGMAFSFVTSRDTRFRLNDIQRYTKVDIKKAEVPTFEEMVEIKKRSFFQRIVEEMEKGGDMTMYNEMVDEFDTAGFDAKVLAATLMKMNFGQENKTSDMSLSADRGDSNDRYDRDRGGRDRGDRGDRPSYRDRAPQGGDRRGTEAGMTRLFINAGRNLNFRPGDIVGAIAGEANIPGDTIGNIDIRDKFSFVDVPSEESHNVIESLNRSQIKGKSVNVEVAS